MLIEANGATETDELLFLTMDSKLSQYTPPLQLTVVDAGVGRNAVSQRARTAQAATATHLLSTDRKQSPNGWARPN